MIFGTSILKLVFKTKLYYILSVKTLTYSVNTMSNILSSNVPGIMTVYVYKSGLNIFESGKKI